eukprot:TRINITY_DN29523_c0_g1_i1.p1 TRINITY_DN29523_c0_g1~~TRINITY_DN29523_c0_g1_i1.p1  ORF type:complete len:448 (+),score=89.63 TRINITY_DN29523_c0_g1_i1:77-1345(+)
MAAAASSAAAAAAAACGGTRAVGWDGVSATELPELGRAGPLCGCGVGARHVSVIALCGGRVVHCAGDNSEGQLGVGDTQTDVSVESPAAVRDEDQRIAIRPRQKLVCTRPALRAVRAVCCGEDFTVALHHDGSLSSWGSNCSGQLGRVGDGSRPGAVQGLPPVAVLAVGYDFAMAVTRHGEVFAWGCNGDGELALGCTSPPQPAPVRVESLCGRGVRRVACSAAWSAAEVAAGELLWWGWDGGAACASPAVLHGAAEMQWPLRSLAAGDKFAVAADAAGAVWLCGVMRSRRGPPSRVRLEGQRTVHLVASPPRVPEALALTDDGGLWDIAGDGGCRNIRDESPALPQGLVPCGGSRAEQVVLIPSHCCGKPRLCLFARIAAHLRLPSDVVLAVLLHFMMDRLYITGNNDDPFGPACASPAFL